MILTREFLSYEGDLMNSWNKRNFKYIETDDEEKNSFQEGFTAGQPLLKLKIYTM